MKVRYLLLFVFGFYAYCYADGAGILPFSRDSQGEIYFYIAREAIGPHANKWCGFGGTIDPGESIEDGASREFIEESMNVFRTKDKKWMPTPLEVKQELRKHGLAVTIPVRKNFKYTEYLLEVHHEPLFLFNRFNSQRQKLLERVKRVSMASPEHKDIKAKLEKDVLAIVKLDDFKQTIYDQDNTIKILCSSNPQNFPRHTVVPLRSSFFNSIRSNGFSFSIDHLSQS